MPLAALTRIIRMALGGMGTIELLALSLLDRAQPWGDTYTGTTATEETT